MEIKKTSLDGVYIVEPRVFEDERGYFFESFSQRDFDATTEKLIGRTFKFVQDNESKSSYGVIRGLHYQRMPFTQTKLVRCVAGRILDVAVDLRRDSPTFGKYVAVELSGSNHRQLLICKGFAHGFSVLSETAVFQYKCDEFYHPESEGSIFLADPSLNIDWLIPVQDAVLSARDKTRPPFVDFADVLDY